MYSRVNGWVRDKIFDFDFLLGLRALACFAVIFLHMYYSLFNQPKELLKQYPNILSFLLADGTSAVLLFFTLSGYLMFKIFDLNNYTFNITGLIKFYIGRIKRIVPLYLFVLVVGILFVDTTLLKPNNWQQLSELFTFRQYFSGPKDIIYEKHQWFSVAWSLVVEMQYYLVAPLIAFILYKVRNIWVNLVLFGVANYFIYIKYYEDLVINNSSTLMLKNISCYFFYFLSGAILVNLIHNQWINKVLSNLYVFLPFLVVAIFYLPIWVGQNPNNYLVIEYSKHLRIIVHLLFLLAIGIFESMYYYMRPSKMDTHNILNNFKNWKKSLEFFGHLSYGMYLWHLLIIFQLNNIIQKDDLKYLNISELRYVFIAGFVIIAISTIISLFTYLNIELYWLRKKPKTAA